MTQAIDGEAGVLRPLTAQEEIYWQLTFNDQIHPVIAAHVVGRTVAEQWRTALDALQARHSLLQVSIEVPTPETPAQTQPFFRRHVDVPIPLRIVPWTSVSRWEDEIERELAIPFRLGEAPLIRAVLIHAPDRSILILGASHSISDGLSLSFMVRDMLSAIAGQPLEPLAPSRSAEDLLGVEPVSPTSPAADALQPSPVRGEPPSITSLRFTAALTERVVALSRQNGTTLHGALAAAIVLAMRRQVPRFRHETLRMISPVNVRSLLGAGEECGMYFTSPKAEFDPARPAAFWDMARATRQNIVDASTREALLAVTAAMQGMTANGLTKAAAADTLRHAFAIDVLLTNLGRTPYGSEFEGLELESLWTGVLGGLPGIQTVGAATTNGALCLLLTSREPVPSLLEVARTILADVCAGTEVR